MTVAAILLAYAAAAGTLGARVLARAGWPARAPLLGIITYLAAAWSVLAALGLAGLTLAVHATALGGALSTAIGACVLRLRLRPAGPRLILAAHPRGSSSRLILAARPRGTAQCDAHRMPMTRLVELAASTIRHSSFGIGYFGIIVAAVLAGGALMVRSYRRCTSARPVLRRLRRESMVGAV